MRGNRRVVVPHKMTPEWMSMQKQLVRIFRLKRMEWRLEVMIPERDLVRQ
jgi:hypothetical protein